MILIEKLLCKINLHRPTCKYRTDEEARIEGLKVDPTGGYSPHFAGYFCAFCDKPLSYQGSVNALKSDSRSIGVWG